MARTSAMVGKGTTLGYAASAVGPFTGVGEVTECSVPEWSVGSVEATHYTSDAIERLSTDWEDVGEVAFTLNYVKAQVGTLDGLKNTEKYWQVLLPDGSSYVWYGWISKVGNAVPLKDIVKQTITLTNSGALTFAAGS